MNPTTLQSMEQPVRTLLGYYAAYGQFARDGILVLILLGVIVLMWRVRSTNDGLTTHQARGRELARMAVGHAEQVGYKFDGTKASGEERLRHSLDGFRLLDPNREFPDSKARVLIEAAVAERNASLATEA